MAKLVATPGQTVGPFFGYALPYAGGEDLVDRTHPHAVRLHGRVTDGAGAAIPDALVELWQADEQGNIPHEPGSLRRDGYTFTGFGRAAVDDTGHYQFTTVEPGATDAGRPPFFMITVFARGLLDKLHTRAYLPEAAAQGGDAVLSALAPDRVRTLIATRDGEGSLLFDIRLQGDQETVFLDFGA
ncbi:protocatechuate 3,4-dioxygenase alpha subunit [Homoserinimonas aerilata]|uniref:Protocatechuate 3,4-dioxygenase alpha subunit n=1 Tax=Homoserinimonas aerilata TaxID=1162970 RepID=A0A542YKQ0_9MICO|nr:protocatechuate 3,4-dioxygenase subunit alpha [Homoserinimonas aerilata]TQL48504.1 protocatechuate 3,4-dioxygenase alpha subunit [Homoserinimonas aerilata]